MSPLSRVWHIVWFLRVICSCVLFLVVIRRRIDKQFPLFTVYTGWIAVIGTVLVAMNYAPFVSNSQYFAGVVVSNGVEAALAFVIIYQIFAIALSRYPVVRRLGSAAFRGFTLVFVGSAVLLAWLVPGLHPNPWLSSATVVERTARILQCGQLVFLFLFCGYFRLSWRSRLFGIALGLGVLTSTSLAINAIRSQLTSISWDRPQLLLAVANDTTFLLAILVWLAYLWAPERSRVPARGLVARDLETWNRELERMLEP